MEEGAAEGEGDGETRLRASESLLLFQRLEMELEGGTDAAKADAPCAAPAARERTPATADRLRVDTAMAPRQRRQRSVVLSPTLAQAVMGHDAAADAADHLPFSPAGSPCASRRSSFRSASAAGPFAGLAAGGGTLRASASSVSAATHDAGPSASVLLDPDVVVDRATQVLLENPRDARARVARAAALVKKADHGGGHKRLLLLARAVADYGKVIGAGGDDLMDAHYLRGRAYDRLGQVEKSIADYTEALRIDPNHHNAAYARAAAYNLQGNFSAAISDYELAFSKDQSVPASPRLAPEDQAFLETAFSRGGGREGDEEEHEEQKVEKEGGRVMEDRAAAAAAALHRPEKEQAQAHAQAQAQVPRVSCRRRSSGPEAPPGVQRQRRRAPSLHVDLEPATRSPRARPSRVPPRAPASARSAAHRRVASAAPALKRPSSAGAPPSPRDAGNRPWRRNVSTSSLRRTAAAAGKERKREKERAAAAAAATAAVSPRARTPRKPALPEAARGRARTRPQAKSPRARSASPPRQERPRGAAAAPASQPVCPPRRRQKGPQETLRRAAAAVRAGDFVRAAALYDDAAEDERWRPEAMLGHGQLLLRAGRVREALAPLSMALRTHAQRGKLGLGAADLEGEAHLCRGSALAREGRTPEALADMDAAARSAATPALRARALCARAALLLRESRPAEAAVDLTAALEAEPDNEAARLRRARCLLACGRHEEAERDASALLCAWRDADAEVKVAERVAALRTRAVARQETGALIGAVADLNAAVHAQRNAPPAPPRETAALAGQLAETLLERGRAWSRMAREQAEAEDAPAMLLKALDDFTAGLCAAGSPHADTYESWAAARRAAAGEKDGRDGDGDDNGDDDGDDDQDGESDDSDDGSSPRGDGCGDDSGFGALAEATAVTVHLMVARAEAGVRLGALREAVRDLSLCVAWAGRADDPSLPACTRKAAAVAAPRALVARSSAFKRLGVPGRALDDLTAALSHPHAAKTLSRAEVAAALGVRAFLLAKNGRLADAMADLDRLLALEPSNAAAAANRAAVAKKLDKRRRKKAASE